MDTSKYSELRARLQKQSELENYHFEWFRRFIMSVVAHMNNQHGTERQTCRFGMLENGEFLADKIGALGSSFELAIEIRFNTPSGDRLFAHAVPFKAVINDDVLTFKCVESQEIAQFTFEESKELAARQTIAMMADGPVEDAIDLAIARRSTLSAS